MVALNKHFVYQMLMDLLEIRYIDNDRDEYFGGKGITCQIKARMRKN